MNVIEIPCLDQPESIGYTVHGFSLDCQQRTNNETQSFEEDISLSVSFEQLLRLYSMYVNRSDRPKPTALSGGLQQFLIRHKHSKPTEETKVHQPRKGAGSDFTTIHDLPDSLLLHIYSYLEAKDLCIASEVCRHWYTVSCDNILWRNKLYREVFSWNVISHNTNPDMYEECQSDWSYKDIYLRCSPEVSKALRMQEESAALHQLSSMLRYFLPKKTPRIAMFGPGLESSTSGLVRKIIYEDNHLFEKLAMFPGKFGGLGSGFTLRMNNSHTFHLSTLYTSTKQERQGLQPGQRLQNNRMLAVEAVDVEAGQEASYQLRPAMQELCRTLDAFVFVVDAGETKEAVQSGRAELFAMVNEIWAAPDVPVMVLSCVKDSSHSRLSCIDVVRCLNLSQLSRPWQVRDCVVEGLEGIQESLEWTVDMTQKR